MAPEIANSQKHDEGGFEGFALEVTFAGVSSSTALLDLGARLAHTPRDRLLSVMKTALDEDPNNLKILLNAMRTEADPERREDLFRSLRSAYVNCSSDVQGYQGEAQSTDGFRSRLTIVHVPDGPRRGAGLLTDFHLVSQLCLGGLGELRPLPLPSRFPSPKFPGPGAVVEWPGTIPEMFKPEDFQKVEFGRSSRFNSQGDKVLGDTSYKPVLKAGRGPDSEALSKLQFEAAMMDYLCQHRAYFGLESEIPVPLRGPSNRVAAWRFEGRNHLYYGASEGYFNYVDELSTAQEIEECGARVVRDLMRLARFGIFHTEPAPIFHSVAQQRRFLWNVGGLLPGAGDLEYWQESFGHSNFRQSGIADFEHFNRWRSMPAVVSIVNDTEDGSSLGFQYHLGNALFCGMHVMALGYHRLGKSFADHPESFRRVMKDAYQAFTGSEWIRYEDDVEEATVVGELGTLGAGPHVGEFAGAYPHQNFIKALYAFTLRAIPEFVSARPFLRDALPSKDPAPEPQPSLPHSVPDFVSDIYHVLEEINRSYIVSAIVTAGLPPELQHKFVGCLRGKDLAKVQTSPESAPRIAIKARAIVQILKDLLPAETAQRIILTLAPLDPKKVGRHVPLEDLAKMPESWCF